jgi:phosphatidylserine/phosphatidylglycerophosphate/cardiolipin synthase-like enzyme
MGLSARSHFRLCHASSWEEIWEAGPYYERLSELLEDAQQYAIFSGWQIDSRLPLPHPVRPGLPVEQGTRESLFEKVVRICEAKPGFQFYFLIWDHSYLYVPERELWQGRVWDQVHPRVHFIFDNRHPFGGAHHEKICLFDGEVALCGGIDLCDNRWDGPEHLFFDPRRSLNWREDRHGPYHDLAVQISGPICGELQNHLKLRWDTLSSIPFPSPRRSHSANAGHAVYLSRTLADSPETSSSPRIVREIEFLFRELIGKAQQSIWLEGQYFWSRMITDLLTAKMHAMRGKDFEITLVLAELARAPSFTRKMAAYEMNLLKALQEAAEASGTKLVMGVPYSHPPEPSSRLPARPIYIHSKLMIVDDLYMSVGSANLASRALRIDTEINLTLEARTDAERLHIRRVRDRARAHWGLGQQPQKSGYVHIHAFKPRSIRSPQRTLLPYPRFFDPELPAGYLFKKRLRSLLKRNPRTLPALLLGTAWILAAKAMIEVAGPPSQIYAAILAGAWFLPVPPLPVAILASLQLGPGAGTRLLVGSMWISSLIGYLGARSFPNEFSRLLARSLGARRAHEVDIQVRRRLGARTFSSLIGLLADPRIEFRSKTTYQGICFVPLPWFALGSGLVWPAAGALIVRIGAIAIPHSWRTWIQEHPKEALGVTFGAMAIATLFHLGLGILHGKESSDAARTQT